jgi:catalase
MVLNRVVDNFFAETEQVAFCTQNIVLGIDHSNDPLLQGRNFSYLDTQTKRLGGPNFTHIPINAPKCPMHHFQQDGHMAMTNPKGRANYEPNSWEDNPGPRENPNEGFHSYTEDVEGTKVRSRSPSFADHYSQAYQFYISQTDTEQGHIADAFVFELSKVEREDIRLRMVAHLRNVDESLAKTVADGLGFESLPDAPTPAATPRKDLPASDALSILKNGPNSFGGRKLGVFVSEGTDAKTFDALKVAAEKEGAVVAVIAPHIGGIRDSNGRKIPVNEKIDGGPSVLFDAVALLPGTQAVEQLAKHSPVRDFVSDAFAHCKFIGFNEAAKELLKAAGIEQQLDEGCLLLDASKADDSATEFLERCRSLRYWPREGAVNKM